MKTNKVEHKTIEFKSEKEYQEALIKMKAYDSASEAWRKANKRNCVTQDVYSLFPFAGEVTNDLRSAIETYEFIKNPPKKYYLYPKNGSNKVTTWTGQELGTYSITGVYKGSFGDRRLAIRVKAINGKEYFGTIYGTYARIKMCKASETK